MCDGKDVNFTKNGAKCNFTLLISSKALISGQERYKCLFLTLTHDGKDVDFT